MAARFVNFDYDTPLILPPNLRDWVPANHLAHFILDAVEGMDLRQVRVNDRGTGSPQYPPRTLLALLLYCYATGVFGSRRIEQATYDSVPIRMICGDTHNNAGITRDQLLLGMSEEDFDQVLATNLKGTWNFLRAGARHLMKSSGRVVNVASVVGLIGNPGQSNYAASKAGVLGLTRSLAKELASRGVCVNAVLPGYIDTDMTAALGEKARAELCAQIPLGRVGTADDVARLIEFLVGPGGVYITGQTLIVDGGLSL